MDSLRLKIKLMNISSNLEMVHDQLSKVTNDYNIEDLETMSKTVGTMSTQLRQMSANASQYLSRV